MMVLLWPANGSVISLFIAATSQVIKTIMILDLTIRNLTENALERACNGLGALS